MARNLLPLLRSTGIPQGSTGWNVVNMPEELAKLDFGDPDDRGLRTRIQSIPSPWARMLLFRAALEDEQHPARPLVVNELLDAFEFLWLLGSRQDVNVSTVRVPMEDLHELGDATGSVQAADFAKALHELAPRSAAGQQTSAAFDAITILLVQGSPVLASSPFTGVFTAEDASAVEATAPLFRYASTAEARPLTQRPPDFRRYLATVIVPELGESQPPAGQNREWGLMRRILGGWLKDEIKRIPGLSEEATAVNDFRGAATSLALDPFEDLSFGGLTLYRRRPGAEIAGSRWLLRGRKTDARAPLVLDKDAFDGVLYDGAARIPLTALNSRDRSTLPGLGVAYPWVNPAEDWLSDKILLLNEPLERKNVLGLSQYTVAGSVRDQRWSTARLTLPLRAPFFHHFTVEEVDDMLSIEVRPSGELDVTLRVPVGVGEDVREVLVRRTYSADQVVAQAGPELAIWPTFRDERWDSYVLFRRDVNAELVHHLSVVGLDEEGRPLHGETVMRTPQINTLTFRTAPAVLELLSHEGPSARSLGVVLPRYRPTAARSGSRWQIGIDFGTSNTVVGIRENDSETVQLFGVDEFTLPLTEPGVDTHSYHDAYFLPPRVTELPFGTAVVALRDRSSGPLAEQPLGARVSVPFGGHVYREQWNQIVGDLKWSADQDAYYLSSSFLRHVLATVLAAALERGIDPNRISLSWAYPRAFTPNQLDHLRRQWTQVVRLFHDIGLPESALKEELDESHSVLRHFVNMGQMHVSGDTRAILDIGGGTTDIAVYGGGRVLALDSVVLGGRNLTGPMLHAPTNDQRVNPFVAAFFRWAGANHLPEKEREIVGAYLLAGEVHLGFSYLVGTRWFADGEAARFSADLAFHRFQLMVFYFFGALFHYLGLGFRVAGSDQVPYAVVLGGNGSRYLNWLTNFEQAGRDSIFRKALGDLLLSAADADSAEPTIIELSTQPKAEVAGGLAAKDDIELVETVTARTSVVGESVSLPFSTGARSFAPTDRLRAEDVLFSAMIPQITWPTGKLEIERFHESLIEVSRGLKEYGGQWEEAAARYEDLFGCIPSRELREETIQRLEKVARREKGFRGSIFMVEVAVVLERMLKEFFEEST